MLATVKRIYNEHEFEALCKRTSEINITSYFETLIQQNKIGHASAATYMFALNNFFKFISTTYFSELYIAHKHIFKIKLENLQEKTRTLTAGTLRWATSYQKQSAALAEARYENERKMILTEDEKWHCLRGPLYTKAKKFETDYTHIDRTNIIQMNTTIRNCLMLNPFTLEMDTGQA